jgi:hypothetical protein
MTKSSNNNTLVQHCGSSEMAAAESVHLDLKSKYTKSYTRSYSYTYSGIFAEMTFKPRSFNFMHFHYKRQSNLWIQNHTY